MAFKLSAGHKTCQSTWGVQLLLAFAWCCWLAAAANGTNSQPLVREVGVYKVRPNKVTQYVPTRVTVELNSSLCKGLGNGPHDSQFSLHIRNAAKDGSDAVFAGNTTTNCTHLVFPVTVNSSVRNGSFSATVSTPQGASLQLPKDITIVRPLVLSMAVSSLNVSADKTPFAIAVNLSQPSNETVTVSIDLGDDAQYVDQADNSISWPPGQAGIRSIKAKLNGVPQAGNVTFRLNDPHGAVVDLKSDTTVVSVLSPVVSFQPSQGFYWGSRPPQPFVTLKLQGSSSFASSVQYSTFLYNTSRPFPWQCNTQQSTYDCDVSSNLTLSGVINFNAGETKLPPIRLPLTWSHVPHDAEYHVGINLTVGSNVRVANQTDKIAVFIFGTPLGHCPPGTAQQHNISHSPDGPVYSSSAPLQELQLLMCCQEAASGSDNRNNGSKTAAAHSPSSSNIPAKSRLLDLDPPFRPLYERYTALLPNAAQNAELVIASNRAKDYVVVDASGCDDLSTALWQVLWTDNQRMWRNRYSLSAQKTPCWLRVNVYTADPQRASMSSNSVAPGPDGQKLYRSYMVRIIPLSAPQALSLRSITFVNATTTVITCGIPASLDGLFGVKSAAVTTTALPRSLQPTAQQQQQQQQPAFLLSNSTAAAVQQATGSVFKYRVVDSASNRTIMWSDFTRATCSPDHYVLVPMKGLAPDMQVRPELMQPDNTRVSVSMTETALLSVGIAQDPFATAGHNTAAMAAAAAAETPTGLGSGVVGSAAAVAPAGSRGTSDPKLAGASVELPIITTGDEGYSSKTYTLILFSNETAALELVNASVAPSTIGNRNISIAGVEGSADSNAALMAEVFGSRPAEWPLSPAQNPNCSLCSNGTYTSKMDSGDCQVCPPGKYAPSPLSTFCDVCPPGTFTYFWGAAGCRTCLSGTYAPTQASLYCNICPEGLTTSGDGAFFCDVAVGGGAVPSYAIFVSFSVLLNGTSLDRVSRDTTGINGSSEGIVAVLVRGDTAVALNVSLEQVQIMGVRQISSRQLLVNVSATVPVNTEDSTASNTQDLSADQLILDLIANPNTFSRTTQTLGAESATITDVTAHTVHWQSSGGPLNIHAVLWPCLFGSLLLAATIGYTCWHWKRRRRRLLGPNGVPGTGNPLACLLCVGLWSRMCGACRIRFGLGFITPSPPASQTSEDGIIELPDAMEESYAARLRHKQTYMGASAAALSSRHGSGGLLGRDSYYDVFRDSGVNLAGRI